eukprot:5946914-Alexandrium_andersonii.AAC.1
MSASLVGSEMCIRDSPYSFGTPPPRNALGTSVTTPLVVRFGISARKCACLLYTSDAADDM